MDDSIRDSIMNAADRIGAMADEAGDAALYAVTTSKDLLDRLPNGHSRALWLLLNDPGAFRQAEDVRYADDHYRGRMWEGYVCSAGCSVARVGEALTNFEHAIGAHSKSRHVDAEVCDRSRRRLGGEDHSLVQVTVHREGRAGERKEFTNGQLDRLPDYPVIEAAITYDAASGVIEVVADTRETRETMARLFADHLLNTPFPGQRLPIRKYSLDHFKSVQGFPTDVDDNIEHVSVSLLRLMPHDGQGERVTLECMRGTKQIGRAHV